MQTMTANQAKTRFSAFIDMVQKEPVRVMRHDRVLNPTQMLTQITANAQ